MYRLFLFLGWFQVLFEKTTFIFEKTTFTFDADLVKETPVDNGATQRT